jgi:hypothetical protein
MSTLNVTTVAATNIRASSIQDTGGNNGSTPAAIANGIAKAWVNFNGTGTVSIRASFNVSSITDNGVGSYTVNFTTAMPDANYCAVATITPGSSLNPIIASLATDGSGPYSTTQVSVGTWNQNSTSLNDSSRVCVSIFR